MDGPEGILVCLAWGKSGVPRRKQDLNRVIFLPLLIGGGGSLQVSTAFYAGSLAELCKSIVCISGNKRQKANKEGQELHVE